MFSRGNGPTRRLPILCLLLFGALIWAGSAIDIQVDYDGNMMKSDEIVDSNDSRLLGRRRPRPNHHVDPGKGSGKGQDLKNARKKTKRKRSRSDERPKLHYGKGEESSQDSIWHVWSSSDYSSGDDVFDIVMGKGKGHQNSDDTESQYSKRSKSGKGKGRSTSMSKKKSKVLCPGSYYIGDGGGRGKGKGKGGKRSKGGRGKGGYYVRPTPSDDTGNYHGGKGQGKGGRNEDLQQNSGWAYIDHDNNGNGSGNGAWSQFNDDDDIFYGKGKGSKSSKGKYSKKQGHSHGKGKGSKKEKARRELSYTVSRGKGKGGPRYSDLCDEDSIGSIDPPFGTPIDSPSSDDVPSEDPTTSFAPSVSAVPTIADEPSSSLMPSISAAPAIDQPTTSIMPSVSGGPSIDGPNEPTISFMPSTTRGPSSSSMPSISGPPAMDQPTTSFMPSTSGGPSVDAPIEPTTSSMPSITGGPSIREPDEQPTTSAMPSISAAPALPTVSFMPSASGGPSIDAPNEPTTSPMPSITGGPSIGGPDDQPTTSSMPSTSGGPATQPPDDAPTTSLMPSTSGEPATDPPDGQPTASPVPTSPLEPSVSPSPTITALPTSGSSSLAPFEPSMQMSRFPSEQPAIDIPTSTPTERVTMSPTNTAAPTVSPAPTKTASETPTDGPRCVTRANLELCPEKFVIALPPINCECYNFCGDDFVGCCNYDEECRIDCLGIVVAGCERPPVVPQPTVSPRPSRAPVPTPPAPPPPPTPPPTMRPTGPTTSPSASPTAICLVATNQILCPNVTMNQEPIEGCDCYNYCGNFMVMDFVFNGCCAAGEATECEQDCVGVVVAGCQLDGPVPPTRAPIPTISPRPTTTPGPTFSPQPTSSPTVSPQPTISPAPTSSPSASMSPSVSPAPSTSLQPTREPTTPEPTANATMIPSNETQIGNSTVRTSGSDIEQHMPPFAVTFLFPEILLEMTENDLKDVVRVSSVYLNDYMLRAFDGPGGLLSYFETEMVSHEDNPISLSVTIHFASIACFEPESPHIPSKSELQNELERAMSGENLSVYLGMVQALPRSNLFSLVTSAEFTLLAVTETSSIIPWISLAAVAIATIVAAGGVLVYRRRRRGSEMEELLKQDTIGEASDSCYSGTSVELPSDNGMLTGEEMDSQSKNVTFYPVRKVDRDADNPRYHHIPKTKNASLALKRDQVMQLENRRNPKPAAPPNKKRRPRAGQAISSTTKAGNNHKPDSKDVWLAPDSMKCVTPAPSADNGESLEAFHTMETPRHKNESKVSSSPISEQATLSRGQRAKSKGATSKPIIEHGNDNTSRKKANSKPRKGSTPTLPQSDLPRSSRNVNFHQEKKPRKAPKTTKPTKDLIASIKETSAQAQKTATGEATNPRNKGPLNNSASRQNTGLDITRESSRKQEKLEKLLEETKLETYDDDDDESETPRLHTSDAEKSNSIALLQRVQGLLETVKSARSDGR